MDDSCLVTMSHTVQYLSNEQLYLLRRQWVSDVSQVLSQIYVAKFLHKPNVGIRHDNIFQLDYVVVVKFLQH